MHKYSVALVLFLIFLFQMLFISFGFMMQYVHFINEMEKINEINVNRILHLILNGLNQSTENDKDLDRQNMDFIVITSIKLNKTLTDLKVNKEIRSLNDIFKIRLTRDISESSFKKNTNRYKKVTSNNNITIMPDFFYIPNKQTSKDSNTGSSNANQADHFLIQAYSKISVSKLFIYFIYISKLKGFYPLKRTIYLYIIVITEG